VLANDLSAGPEIAPASATASKYFLLIDGLDGGSTDPRHVGWFEINGFELDLSHAVGTGAATFSPLVVDLNLNPGLADVLKDIAAGRLIKSIKIEGVTDSGAAVYDLTLATVAVTQLGDGSGVADSASFFYQALGLVTQTQNADGSFSPAASFGWDVTRNLEIDPTSLPAPSVGGTGLIAELVSPTSHGAITLNLDGSFNYLPDANFNGMDSFVYRASEGETVSNDITVQINVTPVNDAPVATNVAGDANEDTANPVTLTASFIDPDAGDSHTFTIDTTGTAGKVVNNGDGTFSYDPNGKFEALAVSETALDSFSYTVVDSSGASSTATATVTIHGENDPPAASPDVASVHTANTIVADVVHGVLSNDKDPDATDKLSVSEVTFGSTTKPISSNGSATIDGAYGVLTISSNGSFSYTAGKFVPSQGLAQDSFNYTANDGHGGTSQSTLTIAVTDNAYIVGTPGGTLAGGTGKQVLDGSLGQQTIIGSNGKDTLVGGPDDILTGGNGADTFVFRAGFGHNTITDFDFHIDVIQWAQGTFATIESVFSHMASDGHGGTVITYDTNNSVTLLGVSPANLHASDFPIDSALTSHRAGNSAAGTLIVTDSATLSANITLLGQYMASQFSIMADGHGGTVVNDPPVSTTTDSTPLTLAQHA
jgi:VCBS repeat-containing protein